MLVVNEEGASGNGHVSLFVQDADGAWHYFSFASGRRDSFTVVASVLGFSVKGEITYKEIGTADGYDLTTFDGFRNFLTDSEQVPTTASEMDHAVYITGDFSDSFTKAKELYDRQSNRWAYFIRKKYNLLGYNCMHFAIDMLCYSEDFYDGHEWLRFQYGFNIIPNNNIENLKSLGAELK